MLRPVRGVLLIEGEQTGDGRVVAEGATTWVDPPLPLAWLDREQHGDLLEGAPTIGTIDAITRSGANIEWSGAIDDEIPEGAELVRRLEAGSAGGGERIEMSVDPDDWEVELILMEDEDGDEDAAVVVVACSGSGRLPAFRSRTAAAGDPDPGEGGGDEGTTLFTMAADEMIERYTRLRIRGATACSIAAFAGAYLELAPAAEGQAEEEPAEEVDEEPEAQAASAASSCPCGNAEAAERHTGQHHTCSCSTVRAAGAPALLRGLVVPDRPAREVFAEPGEPDGSLNIDEYRVHGYVALWETCHTGYPDRCVPPPREPDYTPYRVGSVEVAEGGRVPTGALTWGIPHAALTADLLAAFAHYADSRHGFADVVVGANAHGIWHSGALRPGATREDVRVLRALSLSGDWRFDPRSGRLRMIAALAVNHPGYPVPRRSLVASTVDLSRGGVPDGEAGARYVDGQLVALVAAGMAPPAAAASDGLVTVPAGLLRDLEALASQHRETGRARLRAAARADAAARLANA